jgi:hypothetical protein
MKRMVLIIGISLLASFLFLACANGGGSDDDALGNLQGTWRGWIEDDNQDVWEFTLEIDGDGNVIDVTINGASTGDTGHINEDWDENLFHVLYSGGDPLTHGYMIVDDQYSHATYGDRGSAASDYYLGMLEKGAASLPAHAVSDIAASYPVGGAYVYTNDSGTWNFVGDDIVMTVDTDLSFSGTAPGETFTGAFDAALFDTTHGRYAGSLTNSMTMDITAFLSPDGEAVAAFGWEIDTTPDEIEDFILIGLKR